MIASFADRDTENLWNRIRVPAYDPRILRTALRKLAIIDAAVTLDDLRVPPGNRLESLQGRRAGQYSIRVNSQWRVCFRWIDGNAHEVQIVDYH